MTPARFASAALCLVSLILLGFILGGFAAGRVMPGSEGEMGWDRLADAIGGAAVGTLLGLVAGVIAVRRFTVVQRLLAAAIALPVAAAVLLAMRAMRTG